MRPIPHDYQLAAIESTRDHIRAGVRRIVIVAPVGAGKTTIAAEIIYAAMEKGSRVLFIAHRRELIDQASKRLDRYAIPHGIIMPSSGRHRPNAAVQVASVQTLSRRIAAYKADPARKPLPPADLIICDESHRAMAKSWRAVLDQYPNAVILGLTATPWRLDGSGLRDIFQEMVEVCQPRDLIDRDPAVLVAPRAFRLAMPDLSSVKTKKGEYDPEQLEKLMATRANIDEILTNWQRIAPDRQTIVFATGIKHSKMIVDAFESVGVRAAHVDGNMTKYQRASVLEAFERGEIQVVSNVNILTEGYDNPPLGCAVMARPTQSLSLFIQMAGRVMRAAPGKRDAFILDHAGNTLQHGNAEWPREWDLDGKPKRARDTVSPTTCLECYSMFEPGVTVCPYCGAAQETKTRESSQTPAANRGLLVEAPSDVPDAPMPTLEKRDRWMLAYWTPKPTQEQKRALYNELAKICLAKGYKSGWIAVGFKKVFGHWPNAYHERACPQWEAVAAKKQAEREAKTMEATA